MKYYFFALCFLFFVYEYRSQTNGNFESGNTGWTFLHSGTNIEFGGNGVKQNRWFIGSAAKCSGSNGMYVCQAHSTGTNSYYFNGPAQYAYAYQDIAVPTNSTATISFTWKNNGEAGGDYFSVYAGLSNTLTMTSTRVTQPSGSGGHITGTPPPNASRVSGPHAGSTTCQSAGPITLSSDFAGQTVRIVFMWRNDGSVGVQAPATIDDIVITPVVILPVELTEFYGIPSGNTVDLYWTTATEKNNSHYTIETSTDGNTFRPIGEVKGNNNSYHAINYNFTHDEPVHGINYYRLKQTDYDGSYRYSDIIDVDLSKDKEVSIKNIYPNPTANQVSFDLYSPVDGPLRTEIGDVTGKVVSNDIQNIEKGKTMVTTKMDDLGSGIYFLKVSFEKTGFTSMTRVIKN